VQWSCHGVDCAKWKKQYMGSMLMRKPILGSRECWGTLCKSVGSMAQMEWFLLLHGSDREGEREIKQKREAWIGLGYN